MRCFVAIAVPEHIRESLVSIAEGTPVGRPAPPENLHLTLAFLDELSDGEVVAVHERLSEITGARFSLQIDGMDHFGGRKPKILAATLRRSDPLMELHATVRGKVAAAGIVLARERYRPHITLARINRPPNRDEAARLGRFLESHALLRPPAFEVEAFTLFRSDLGRGPAVHTELASYPLT
ncbi:RNA 2',3'-cyclic phosphodiesterase [Tropicimonas marinistellae]|uniref:RNA 2',3'-cyclic phosphodiesterase n=1 Tax=Tropicimonas marinistellae TaxID=1739787 RepID=UPI0008315E61|nr:RNA 2',3'-cyclic phosphodiesterase [Tropicimonas marinistellae]